MSEVYKKKQDENFHATSASYIVLRAYTVLFFPVTNSIQDNFNNSIINLNPIN